MKLSTKKLVLCSLFTALTAILSQISIPLPFTPIPINLATLSVFVAGGFLGAKFGAISQIVYVILGTVGIPVFANFKGGIGVLVGPTGGYIAGYILAAFVVGYMIENSNKKFYIYPLAMAIGLAACYILGTMWFMFVTSTGLASSLAMCVIPFIPGDIFKIIAGSILVSKLMPILKKQNYI